MPFKKGYHPPTQFKKGQSGNPKGQPRKVLSRINIELAKEGFEQASGANVIEAYNLLINLTEERIKQIISDTTYPMFMRIVGKEMLSKGGPEMIEKMLDRAHGKAITKVAQTTKDGEDAKTELTDSQLEKLLHAIANTDTGQ